jgi:DNA polymerase-3 subunit delta'
VSFAKVRGQSAAVERLRLALSSGRLAHAYLFTGPEGVGKRTLARELARALLCEKRGEKGDDACDRCASCRAVESGNSGDYGTLSVEEADGSFRPVADSDRQIKVASIRAMSREMNLKGSAGRSRAFLIPGADRMNEEAANALLKTLEEPPGSRLLLLTSARPEALLPTVISRVARVRLGRLSAKDVADFLAGERGLSIEDARELAAASGGSIGAALAGSAEKVRRKRRFVREKLSRVTGATALAAAEELAAFARAEVEAGESKEKGLEPVRRELLEVLGQTIALYRAALGRSLGESGAGPEEAAERLASAGPERLERCLRSLLRAERAVRDYAAPELVCRVLTGELAGQAG